MTQHVTKWEEGALYSHPLLINLIYSWDSHICHKNSLIRPIPNRARESRKEQEGALVPNKTGFLEQTVAEWGNDSPRSPDIPHTRRKLSEQNKYELVRMGHLRIQP